MVFLFFILRTNWQRKNIIMSKKNNKGKKKKHSATVSNARLRLSKKIDKTKPDKDIKAVSEKIKYDEMVSDLKYHLFQTRCWNFIKKAALVITVLLAISLLVSMGALIVYYIKHDNVMSTIISTVVQWITSIVSLAIGVWGLVLAIKSDRRTDGNVLSIDNLLSTRKPTPILEENDVDKTKL